MTMVGRNMMLRVASMGERLMLGVVSIVVITTGVGNRAFMLSCGDTINRCHLSLDDPTSEKQ